MSLEETTNQAKQPQLNKQETNQSTASALPSEPLSGHLNHLSDKQSEALGAFKKECVARNIYTPAGEGVKASHDDSTLLYVAVPPYMYRRLSMAWAGVIDLS